MNLKKYFKKAEKEGWAIGQFNFSTLEQMRGILSAASELRSPVILGTSEGESRFFGLKEIVALKEISILKYKVPAFLNLDHGKDFKWIKEAIKLGYSSIHFDGSKLPFKENIKMTKKAVNIARKVGIFIEGELGYIKGGSKIHKEEIKIKEEDLTSVENVEEFIKKTGVDSLAIAIGSIHGISSKMPEIDFERLDAINKKSSAFLVLHGASGIKDDDIRKAIKKGIVKVNINTELRSAWKNSLAPYFSSSEIVPYKIMPAAEEAVKEKVKEKIILLGSKNKV